MRARFSSKAIFFQGSLGFSGDSGRRGQIKIGSVLSAPGYVWHNLLEVTAAPPQLTIKAADKFLGKGKFLHTHTVVGQGGGNPRISSPGHGQPGAPQHSKCKAPVEGPTWTSGELGTPASCPPPRRARPTGSGQPLGV